MLFAVQPDFKIPPKNMQELLAFVRVRLAAASAGFDSKKMGLHYRLPPGEKLHANAGSGFQNFALAGPDKSGIVRGGFKERQNICAIETRDTAQRRNGGTHLPAFEGAEKTNRNLSGARDLREGETAARAQSAEALAGKRNGIGWSRD